MIKLKAKNKAILRKIENNDTHTIPAGKLIQVEKITTLATGQEFGLLKLRISFRRKRV